MIGLLVANLWAISPRLEEGWPFYLPVNEHGGYTFGPPLQPFEGGWAFVTQCAGDSIRVLNASGSPVPPWPLSPGGSFSIYFLSLCLGDINGDGNLDLLYSGSTSSATGRIYAHDILTGGILPGWPANFSNPIFQPALWDMDGDGSPDVVALEDFFMGDHQHLTRVHVLGHDGSELPGWPRDFQGPSYPDQRRPALGDPDRDGSGELVIATGDSVLMLDAYGNTEPGWPFILGQGLPPHWMERCGFMALADIDGDGFQEILVSTYIQDTSFDTTYVFPDTSRLFALSADGSVKPMWPVIFEQAGCPFILSDVDGDGLPEIFVIEARLDEYYRWRHTFLFLGPEGEVKFSFPEPGYRHFVDFRWCGAADTDGDGAGEIIFSGIKFRAYEASIQGDQALKPSETGLIALDRFGRETWNIRLGPHLPPDSLFDPYSFWTNTTPTFSDVDGDGFLELAHDMTEIVGEGCYKPEHLWLYTWEIPGITNWRIDWSGPAHDPWNTNNYDFWPDNPSLAGESGGESEEFLLSVFPNPGKGKLNLRLMLPSPMPVIIKAYDPTGRLVLVQDIGVVASGSHSLEMPLMPGVYFFTAEAGSWTRRTKGVVIR